MNKYGSVNDLRWSEHAERCKVIHPDGKVTYEEAMYWGDRMGKIPMGAAKKARKTARQGNVY